MYILNHKSNQIDFVTFGFKISEDQMQNNLDFFAHFNILTPNADKVILK